MNRERFCRAQVLCTTVVLVLGMCVTWSFNATLSPDLKPCVAREYSTNYFAANPAVVHFVYGVLTTLMLLANMGIHSPFFSVAWVVLFTLNLLVTGVYGVGVTIAYGHCLWDPLASTLLVMTISWGIVYLLNLWFWYKRCKTVWNDDEGPAPYQPIPYEIYCKSIS